MFKGSFSGSSLSIDFPGVMVLLWFVENIAGSCLSLNIDMETIPWS